MHINIIIRRGVVYQASSIGYRIIHQVGRYYNQGQSDHENYGKAQWRRNRIHVCG